VKVDDINSWQIEKKGLEGKISAKNITAAEWNFVVGEAANVLKSTREIQTELSNFAYIFQGLVTGADKVFIISTRSGIENGLLKPFLLTGALDPYSRPVASARIIYPYEIVGGKARLLTGEELKKRFPKGWSYLLLHRDELMNRERGKWKHENWYAYGRSQNLAQMDSPKLIVQVIAQRPTILYDDRGLYMTGGGSCVFWRIWPPILV
jgi:hypothetical protein